MQVTWFQFQTGAIKRRHVIGARGVQSCEFQFQTGAIKSRISICGKTALSRFNSKLVRLKVRLWLTMRFGFPKRFNSKLVRLKVLRGCRSSLRRIQFQFQTGAIKRENILRCWSWDWCSFNSKLVRLKVACMWYLLVEVKFQFQTGAIKSNRTTNCWGNIMSVSIPNWCD